MNKDFIPYEQALALKELGFDEPCFGIWMERGDRHDVIYVAKQEDAWMAKQNDGILAPLYQQAFRWFREKYQLHNGIYPYYDEYEFQIKDFRLPTNTPINGGLMKYEEAELACLIKLIEIVKNK
jgi:hypothetical protein